MGFVDSAPQVRLPPRKTTQRFLPPLARLSKMEKSGDGDVWAVEIIF